MCPRLGRNLASNVPCHVSELRDFGLANAAYKTIFLNRSAFAITDTDDKLIAAAAIIGESSNPKAG